MNTQLIVFHRRVTAIAAEMRRFLEICEAEHPDDPLWSGTLAPIRHYLPKLEAALVESSNTTPATAPVRVQPEVSPLACPFCGVVAKEHDGDYVLGHTHECFFS